MEPLISHRATHWQLRTRTLDLPRHPLLMGIINVTPDSFSDGGRFLEPAAAIEHAHGLIAEGADLLDIGGESTRPGSQPVPLEQELDRIVPVVEALCRQVSVPISVDTSKAAVARAAIAVGAEIINDVTALAGDPAMLDVVRQSGAGICVMHMQGTPQSMQISPHYENVVDEVFQFLHHKRESLLAAKIAQDRICIDPGVGFGKSTEHNLALLQNCWRFHALGCPILVGHSRKAFIGHVMGDAKVDRGAGTIGVACALAAQGVQLLRVHDVALLRQSLSLFAATSAPFSLEPSAASDVDSA